jgi:hypothetical protein
LPYSIAQFLGDSPELCLVMVWILSRNSVDGKLLIDEPKADDGQILAGYAAICAQEAALPGQTAS